MNRYRFSLKGAVQGIGFRPTVARLARDLQLSGWVCNADGRVLIEVQGEQAEQFLDRLMAGLPSLARIDSLEQARRPLETENAFEIRESLRQDNSRSLSIVPDQSICQSCLTELFDPESRYYLYPFLNCTQCGPRLSIVRQLPYDRPSTAMAEFPLCPACQQIYSDPADRRYHAQPTACPACGPTLSHSLDQIATALQQGQIVAIKAVGGYQLLANAFARTAVQRLRQIKMRPSKAFALMGLNLASLNPWVKCSAAAERALTSPARPIVILPMLSVDQDWQADIAPGLNQLGVMLPSSPLYYLLFHALAQPGSNPDWLSAAHENLLVITSANVAGEPMIIDDEAALNQLAGQVDLVVTANRPIVNRLDDSVLRLVDEASLFLRRARGYVPNPIPLSTSMPPVLALGAQQKVSLCLIAGQQAWVSQPLGSLSSPAQIDSFHQTLDYWLQLTGIQPQAVACDRHPDFYSSRFAYQLGMPVMPVQHHHAHLAAVMAEHHLTEPVIGLALDGYGYGDHGQAWGGEIFYLEADECRHLASLSPITLVGGEQAVRQPWRLAVAVLHQLGYYAHIAQRFSHRPELPALLKLLDSQENLPKTSSMGRWFDAVAALLGLGDLSQYEAQAPQRLEALVGSLPQQVHIDACLTAGELNLYPLVPRLLAVPPRDAAAYFHAAIIAALAQWAIDHARHQQVDQVVLGGGCFLNSILTAGLTHRLSCAGIRVYRSIQLPPHDGGLSFGQAWVAGQRIKRGAGCV